MSRYHTSEWIDKFDDVISNNEINIEFTLKKELANALKEVGIIDKIYELTPSSYSVRFTDKGAEVKKLGSYSNFLKVLEDQKN